MSNLNNLVDEVMGLPRGFTALKEVQRQFARPTPLAKAMPALNAKLESVKRTQRAVMKKMNVAPTKEDRRSQYDRLNKEVTRGMAQGKFTAHEVARLEVELNSFAQRHRL